MDNHTSYTVHLHFWDIAPAASDPTQFRFFQSGHVALEVKKEGTTVGYLGWWPRSYSVQRAKRSRGFLERHFDRLSLWFTPVDGRLSSYGGVNDAALALDRDPGGHIDPDEIDSETSGSVRAFRRLKDRKR